MQFFRKTKENSLADLDPYIQQQVEHELSLLTVEGAVALIEKELKRREQEEREASRAMLIARAYEANGFIVEIYPVSGFERPQYME